MGKPKFEVTDKGYVKDIYFLYEILGKFKDLEEIKIFFRDILTSSELRMVKRRWHIACLLDEGWDLRKISERSKTSTATVLKVKKLLEEGRGGLKLALERTRSRRIEKPPEEKPVLPMRVGSYPWILGRSKT